ncbi:hypothetical protein BGZ75_007522 [Mortierella antarctica]|nr:hypothetical protein BGZ75_007522 [Mortierella antarctica]
MPQLLESTRNYLKTSTRLGRRMSQYKDEASGSETSLHLPVDTDSAHPGDHATGIVDTLPHRHTAQRRLSSLFGFEDRSKNAAPEDRAPIMSRRVFPEPQDPPITHSDRMIRRNSRGSERTHRSGKSKSSLQSIWSREGSGNTLSKSHDHGSVHMEQEVPRGRSPTLSLSNTVSTAASTYDTRPSDYASMKHYQAHVWRRNLLEESIMHSLKLGYAERRRSSSRHRSLSSKNDSPRARKTREQALLAAAMGRDLATCPESEVTPFDRNTEPQVNIIDRSLGNISAMQARHQQQQQQPHFRRETNSPYQMDYNASMANITQSFASFTLELPEHQVEHVMSSSMVPDLFKVRESIPRVTEQRTRTRRNSGATLGGGVSMSPRVLTGKKPQSQEGSQSADPHTEDNSPPSATSWAHSVHTALDQTKGLTVKDTSEDQLKALQVSEARAV